MQAQVCGNIGTGCLPDPLEVLHVLLDRKPLITGKPAVPLRDGGITRMVNVLEKGNAIGCSVTSLVHGE